MPLQEVDINRLITWCKLHKFKYDISERGHMVTLTFGKLVVQWWPDRARVVFDGRTKRAVKAPATADFIKLVEERWCYHPLPVML